MALLDGLAAVSAEHRGVVLDVVVRDRPQREVAAALGGGHAAGTVRSRVFNASRGLRRELTAHPSDRRTP